MEFQSCFSRDISLRNGLNFSLQPAKPPENNSLEKNKIKKYDKIGKLRKWFLMRKWKNG